MRKVAREVGNHARFDEGSAESWSKRWPESASENSVGAFISRCSYEGGFFFFFFISVASVGAFHVDSGE